MFKYTLALFMVISVSAVAKPKPHPTPVPTPMPTEVNLTPSSLREYLLNQNIGILEQLNQVAQAKESLNVARGTILPKLNLGVALSGGLSFAVSLIQVVLPFLWPGNWLEMHSKEQAFYGQWVGYYVVELNAYAMAETSYVTALNDLNLLDTVSRQADYAKKIVDITEGQHEIGLATDFDVKQASATLETAKGNLEKAKELVATDQEGLRSMLALDLTTKIKLNQADVPASEIEGQPATEDLLTKIMDRTPEKEQIKYFHEGARLHQKAGAWSWINSIGLNGSGTKPSFGDMKPVGSFSLGFDIFPNYQLNGLQADFWDQKGIELLIAQRKTLSTSLLQVKQAKRALDAYTKAEADQEAAVQLILANYQQGQTDFKSVLQAQTQLITYATNRINAKVELDSLRVALHRLMISDEFAQIHDCKIVEVVKTHSGFLDSIFGKINLGNNNEPCRQKPVPAGI